MKLNKIYIENFLSIEKAEIDFDEFGAITHVIGQNQDTSPTTSNGAGKSSIIEAVVFALFGKTLRKTNEKSITNYYTKGKCVVRLVVNDNVVIERTKKPPRLTLEIDGENYTQDSISETQKYMENTLNTNYSIFTASMVFGQANSMNFLTATPEEKRAIIQSFLSVGDLFRNRAAIRSLKSQALSAKKVAEALMNSAQVDVNAMKGKLQTIQKNRRRAADLLSADTKKFISKYTVPEIAALESERHDLEHEIGKKQHQKMMHERGIAWRKQQLEGDPPKCEKCDWISQHQWDQREEIKAELQKDLSEVKRYEKEIKALNKKIDEIIIPISAHDLETVENYKDSLRSEEFYKDRIKSKKEDVEKHGEEVLRHQKQYDIMKFWENAFSETGIIKYIIRNILEFFNERCNFYMFSLSQGRFSIKFDDSLAEEIFNEGEPCFFDSMSGGEKKRISLAVMLALNDLLLLTGKERSNIVFFDEVADTLDPQGVNCLFEVLEELSQEKKIFIITHNDEFVSLLQNEAENFIVKKKNKITTFHK